MQTILTVNGNAAESKALPFYGLDGNQRNVMTMCNTEEVNHYQDDSLQMVEMPYGQGYYSMMVVMPKKSEYLNDIIEKAVWWGWHNQMTKGMANIRLLGRGQLEEHYGCDGIFGYALT